MNEIQVRLGLKQHKSTQVHKSLIKVAMQYYHHRSIFLKHTIAIDISKAIYMA